MKRETTSASVHCGPLREDEQAMLVDRKGRRYLVRLSHGEAFHTHMGALQHDDIIGLEEGNFARTSQSHKLLVLRPTLADTVRDLPRVSQVIYPKDLGPILVHADVFPRAYVVEAGMGSGALTTALLRAVGEHGQVTSYEVRHDIVERATQNIRATLPITDNLTVKVQDVYEAGIQERAVDRVILDLAEPWRLVASAADALKLGGIFLGFLPTVLQVHQLVMALQEDGRFQLIETSEVIERPWHVTGRSVRPAHRMVAHTGFITTGRRCTSISGLPVTEGALHE